MILKKTGRFFGVLLVFLFCAVFFFLVTILIVKPGAKESAASGTVWVDAEYPPPVRAFSAENATALARVFAHPLPVFPQGSFRGNVRSVPFEGNQALVATLTYPSFTMTCGQPALAAPLQLKKELSPTSIRTDNVSGYSILSMPALYATDDRAHCFYFSDDSAAYALYSDELTLTDLSNISTMLRWAVQ